FLLSVLVGAMLVARGCRRLRQPRGRRLVLRLLTRWPGVIVVGISVSPAGLAPVLRRLAFLRRGLAYRNGRRRGTDRRGRGRARGRRRRGRGRWQRSRRSSNRADLPRGAVRSWRRRR